MDTSPRMINEGQQLKDFTVGLASRLRAEEKRRFWRLIVYMAVLALTLLSLLARIQYNDHQLRSSLAKQCELRNQILEVQRREFQGLIASGDPRERGVWSQSLADLPRPADCQEIV